MAPRTGARISERIADAIGQSAGLVGDAVAQKAAMDRITVPERFEDAVADADFIHECIDEKLDSKRTIFGALERCAKPSAILATTTSSFPVSTFAADLPGRDRCIVVHPATPPHLLPVTEICPAPFTAQVVTDARLRLHGALRAGAGPDPLRTVELRAQPPASGTGRRDAAMP